MGKNIKSPLIEYKILDNYRLQVSIYVQPSCT
jgi:hypothetical protein